MIAKEHPTDERKRGDQITLRSVFVTSALAFTIFHFFFWWPSAPHDIVSAVPTGSKLSELDRYLQRGAGSEGVVYEWGPPGTSEGQEIKTEFGKFARRKIASYDEWRATKDERDRFTGEIVVFHHGSTSSDVNSFTYIKGSLRKKDWGFLPG